MNKPTTARCCRNSFIIAILIALAAPVMAQPNLSPILSATEDAASMISTALSSAPSISAATVPQDLNIEARSEILEKKIEVGQPFHYVATLSWEGDPSWFSIEPPKLDLPKELRQSDVSAGVKTSAAAGGQIGSKYFKYTLVAEKTGSFKIKSSDVEVLKQDASALKVAIPEAGLDVAEKTIPPQTRALDFMKKNGLVLGGALFAIVVGLIVYLFARKRAQAPAEEAKPDPWIAIETAAKRLEGLRYSGEGKQFYTELESALREALKIGSEATASGSLASFKKVCEGSRELSEEFEFLESEITARKYRPDRPLPEDMDQAFRRFKSFIRILKENQIKGVQPK